jgi:hypothetical protein
MTLCFLVYGGLCCDKQSSRLGQLIIRKMNRYLSPRRLGEGVFQYMHCCLSMLYTFTKKTNEICAGQTKGPCNDNENIVPMFFEHQS